MPPRISVRVYPRDERTIVTTTADLFADDKEGNHEICETLAERDIVTKTAKYTRVDGSEHSHDKLQIQSTYSTKRENQSVLLRDEDDEDSLTNLFNLLVAAQHVEKEGNYVVINASDFDPDDTEWLLNTVLKDKNKLNLLSLLRDFVSDETSAAQLRQLFSDHPNRAQRFYAALNYERLSQALDEFKRRVAEGCGLCKNCIEGCRCLESEYQRYLEEHYWILGSEYSEMLERGLTWKGTQDFNMRRTADAHLEVIEIKTPEVVLFKQERGRYIEKKEVVNAINQVDDYQKRVEDNWKALSGTYPDLRLDKVRGKVIIGRSNKHSAEEIMALRRLNARLHGIEVITFDQLIGNAERMLKILGDQRDASDPSDETLPSPSPPSTVDDIPF